MDNEGLQLLRIEDFFGDNHETRKRSLNYVNYTNENYNIVTLQNYNEYYNKYKKKLYLYVRERPKFNKSLGKLSHTNINNVRNFNSLKSASLYCNLKIIPPNSLYKSIGRTSSRKNGIKQSIKLNKKFSATKSVINRLPIIDCKQPVQYNSSPVSKYSFTSCSISNRRKKSAKKENYSEKLIKRAEQFGRFLSIIKSDEAKKFIRERGKKFIEKLNENYLIKEKMKIAIETPVEAGIQRITKENLGIESNVKNQKKETTNSDSLYEMEDHEYVLLQSRIKLRRIKKEIYKLCKELSYLKSGKD